MKKLSINIPEGLGDVLSQEELKHVLGGMGSNGSELGSQAALRNCNGEPPKVRACCNSKPGDPCTYFTTGGYKDGTCQFLGTQLWCTQLNSRPFRQ